MGSNAITGAMPDEIGLLKGLVILDLDGRGDLDDNQITSIPASIGNLVKLQYLFLKGNSIQTVPSEIGQLTSLKRLRLSFNDLTGVPVAFRTLDPTIDCNLKGNLHSGFTCANVGSSSSCCTADNCDGDTGTCYAPP